MTEMTTEVGRVGGGQGAFVLYYHLEMPASRAVVFYLGAQNLA